MIIEVPTGKLCFKSDAPKVRLVRSYAPYIVSEYKKIPHNVILVDFARGPPFISKLAYAKSAARSIFEVS